jgi:hypothetical protein
MYSYNSLSVSGPSPAELIRPYLTVSFETIGFPFCRLLRLAGLRWRYSNPPPHGDNNNSSSSYIATDGESASSSCLVLPLGPMTRF